MGAAVVMQMLLHRVGNGGDNGSVSNAAAVRWEIGSGDEFRNLRGLVAGF